MIEACIQSNPRSETIHVVSHIIDHVVKYEASVPRRELLAAIYNILHMDPDHEHILVEKLDKLEVTPILSFINDAFTWCKQISNRGSRNKPMFTNCDVFNFAFG